MEYNGTIYRPPVESNTLLLPVTEGCTHNNCRFCNMYTGVPFRMLSLETVEAYLKELSRYYTGYTQRIERIYLVGADPFALSAKHLSDRIQLIQSYFPNIKTITMYAAVRNVKTKSDKDLSHLKDMGVNDLYVGVECGLNDVLEYLNKGNSADEAREQCLRLNQAGIRHRDMLMPGAAGKGRGVECALATAKLENEIRPDMILLTTMSAFAGTKLGQDVRNGSFVMAGEKEILTEEKVFLENLELPETYFWAAHSLDSTPVLGYIGESREKMLATLQHSIDTIDEDVFRKNFRRDHL